jgi:cyclopropane fatty-acyl-phospholipid synthase-like methyltransferase
MNAYRERIYQHYVHGRAQALAPVTLDGLASRAATLRDVIRRFFPMQRAAQVLDLGCGHGALLHFARQAGYVNMTGIDVSPEQVAEARRLGIEGVQEGDLLATLAALPEASQDIVVAFDVIEHFAKVDLLPFVDEVRRVLKPGGRWLIHAPNGESPFVGAIRYGDFTHELAFTRASLSQLLLSSGFSRAEFFESGPVAASLTGAVRVALWRTIRLGLRLWLAAETGDTGRSAIFTRNFFTVAFK